MYRKLLAVLVYYYAGRKYSLLAVAAYYCFCNLTTKSFNK